jgi:hypothetical protein
MTREICEGSEYEYGLDNDYGIRLRSTTMPSGERLGIHLPDVEENQVLVSRWEYFYEDRSADSEDEAEFTGNAHTPAASQYHDTVVIIARIDYVINQIASTSSHSLTDLRTLWGMINNDGTCSSGIRRSATMTILKSCLRTACRTDTVPSNRSYYGSYHTVNREKECNEYIKMFQ